MDAEKKGITVRFDESELRELDTLADRYRVSSATIIRWALRALANHVERNEGRLVLPFELGEEAASKVESPLLPVNPKLDLAGSRARRAPKKRGS
jgi:predicted transcriptional regulator